MISLVFFGAASDGRPGFGVDRGAPAVRCGLSRSPTDRPDPEKTRHHLLSVGEKDQRSRYWGSIDPIGKLVQKSAGTEAPDRGLFWSIVAIRACLKIKENLNRGAPVVPAGVANGPHGFELRIEANVSAHPLLEFLDDVCTDDRGGNHRRD